MTSNRDDGEALTPAAKGDDTFIATRRFEATRAARSLQRWAAAWSTVFIATTSAAQEPAADSASLPTANPPTLPAPPAAATGNTSAQPAPTAPPSAGATPAEGATLAATPRASPPAADTDRRPGPDHDLFVRRLAVGYFGLSSLPIAASGMADALPMRGTISAPVVGVRYWFRRNVGVDLGLGFGLTGSSGEVNGAATGGDVPTGYGAALHAGLPLVVASAQHYTFEIIPEASLGATTGTISTLGATDQSVGGYLIDVGARAGAEIHFGFIGIPQLALQASIGAVFRHRTYTWSQGLNSSSLNANTFTTTVQTEPWAIFVDNISALYYL